MVETKMAPEMPLSDAKEQHGQYIAERSYVPTVLRLLTLERADLEAAISEQPIVTFNGTLSRRLDSIMIASEALHSAYGDGHD